MEYRFFMVSLLSFNCSKRVVLFSKYFSVIPGRLSLDISVKTRVWQLAAISCGPTMFRMMQIFPFRSDSRRTVGQASE